MAEKRPKSTNIVFEYFENEIENSRILVQLNPITFEGIEITLKEENGKNMAGQRTLQFDEEIYDDLEADGFKKGNPMEFNLYLSKLKD